jgi:hypothetical protein
VPTYRLAIRGGRIAGNAGGGTVGRYERRQFFESLVEMRDRYADRSADDQAGKPMSIRDAMTYAEAIMLALQAEAEATGLEDSTAAGAGSDGGGSDGAAAGRSAPPDATP